MESFLYKGNSTTHTYEHRNTPHAGSPRSQTREGQSHPEETKLASLWVELRPGTSRFPWGVN